MLDVEPVNFVPSFLVKSSKASSLEDVLYSLRASKSNSLTGMIFSRYGSKLKIRERGSCRRYTPGLKSTRSRPYDSLGTGGISTSMGSKVRSAGSKICICSCSSLFFLFLLLSSRPSAASRASLSDFGASFSVLAFLTSLSFSALSRFLASSGSSAFWRFVFLGRVALSAFSRSAFGRFFFLGCLSRSAFSRFAFARLLSSSRSSLAFAILSAIFSRSESEGSRGLSVPPDM
jgi:hypothetical protein